MVQAIITLGKEEDRIINIVKAHHSLKTKSEAVNFIVSKFREQDMDEFCPICDDPHRPLKQSYINKLDKIQKEKVLHHYNNINELRKAIESA
ncbi:MAG TPA: hypothetical protein VJH37_00560 [Candidatus Nanoarchaeia archaeon]|nr:hypothetical protein [Candidatus Nanoarchaeia archaeon]